MFLKNFLDISIFVFYPSVAYVLYLQRNCVEIPSEALSRRRIELAALQIGRGRAPTAVLLDARRPASASILL